MSKSHYVLAFDPGKSSGVALLRYTDTEPAQLKFAWQFGGGIRGLLSWIDTHISENLLVEPGEFAVTLPGLVTTVSEKFTPIPGRGFNQGLDSTLPLVGEGVLIARGLMPVYAPEEKQWQRPQDMYRHGGKNLAEKKKLSRAFLKKHGLYKMPKELGTPDSDDAMSATLHALNYITHTIYHRPTWDAYYETD